SLHLDISSELDARPRRSSEAGQRLEYRRCDQSLLLRTKPTDLGDLPGLCLQCSGSRAPSEAVQPHVDAGPTDGRSLHGAEVAELAGNDHVPHFLSHLTNGSLSWG